MTIGRVVQNFYDLLGLGRDQSLESVQAALASQRSGWGSRATRAGRVGEQAREQLVLIDAASKVFADEASRDRYDIELAKFLRGVEEPKQVVVDWITRAWGYYFSGDFGAADIAARKAREANPEDPQAYVISAWIGLSDFDPMLSAKERSRRATNYRLAKQWADEAFVLDEDGAAVVDVAAVRGLSTFAVGDPNRANTIFGRGAALAEVEARPYLYFLAVQVSASMAGVGDYTSGFGPETLSWLTAAENDCFVCLETVGEREYEEAQNLLLQIWGKRVDAFESASEASAFLNKCENRIAASKIGRTTRTKLTQACQSSVELLKRWDEITAEQNSLLGALRGAKMRLQKNTALFSSIVVGVLALLVGLWARDVTRDDFPEWTSLGGLFTLFWFVLSAVLCVYALKDWITRARVQSSIPKLEQGLAEQTQEKSIISRYPGAPDGWRWPTRYLWQWN